MLRKARKMTVFQKAINELLGKEQDIDSLDRACVLGLILGSMSEVERRLVASRIGELEIKVLGGGGTSENVSQLQGYCKRLATVPIKPGLSECHAF